MSTTQTIPALGEVWPGQGGIYGGIIPGRNGERSYYVIIGEDLGRMAWGPYNVQSPAASMFDGPGNTAALIADGGEYLAVKAAVAYEADGHSDFYLPAIGELNEIRMNLGEQAWGWPWSSTQSNECGAFTMDFVDIGQYQLVAKSTEFPVRPVRKILID
ncbi:MAG: DUF1566 domain-containing protein [Pseudomonas sp.]|jgi:hypothetical protein